jgi:hypothetical protein
MGVEEMSFRRKKQRRGRTTYLTLLLGESKDDDRQKALHA